MVKGKPKAFRINLLNGNQEYSAGSYIEGNVFLELSKQMVPVKSIKIQLSGMAKVKWYENGPQGSAQVYKNSADICKLKWVIWRNESSDQQQTVSTGLSAGQYEFPFRIQIPANQTLPTSFESTNGSIRYSLTAGISRSQDEEFEHATIAAAITIKDIVNINVPHLMQPISNFYQEMVRTFWHTCGLASLSVTLNRCGYCPGEYIAINTKIENQSTKQINAIYVSLVQTVRYFAIGRSGLLFLEHHQRSSHISRIIQTIEGPGIAAGKTGHWNDGLLLIPATHPTIDKYHTSIVQLSYTVDVTLVFHKARNVCLQTPVTIGTTSVRQQTHYGLAQHIHPLSDRSTTPPPPYHTIF